MNKLILLLLTLLLATSALAVIDPDADMMGMYFDLAADMPCLDGVGPYSMNNLYLIITNPSFDFLYGWEAGYEFVGNGLVLGVTLPILYLPLDFGGFPGNHIVGFGLPQETTPATLVATVSVLYIDGAMGSLDFFLHGAEPGSLEGNLPVVLLEDGFLMTLGLSTADGMVAQINGGCLVVATESLSFDSIKSLYR